MARKAKSDTKPNNLEGDNKEIKVHEEAMKIITADASHVEAADLNDLALNYYTQGKYTEAEPLSRQAQIIGD